MSQDQIRYRRQRDAWREVLPGVFRLSGVPNGFDNDLVAASLWLDGRGHLFGATAAYTLGLDGVVRPSVIEVAVQRGSAISGLKTHRLSVGDQVRVRNVAGLRLPLIEQVLLECAATLEPKSVGLAMDDALRRRMTSVPRLKAFLESNRGRGRRGIKTLRRLIQGRDADDQRVRSVMETKMLRILRCIEGLDFIVNHAIRVDGRRYVIDLFLSDSRVGIECHSRKWHDLERSRSDIRRHRKLTSAGIELLYFDWDDVTFSARETGEEIQAAVARRLEMLGS